MIEFIVYGIPASQGSKNPFGGESNPRTKPWRAVVYAEAVKRMNGRPLLNGPVAVSIRFGFPRPKSHYRTGRYAQLLREDAPEWKDTAPDLDKCQRAILDALTGTVVVDDRQVAKLDASKFFTDRPGAQITVRPLARQAHLLERVLEREETRP